MRTKSMHWERTIIDAAPPVMDLSSLAVGDVDGDNRVEIVTGGAGALLWYRPTAFERNVIAEGRFAVGLALEDLDGDGALEVVTAHPDPETSVPTIAWFKPGADVRQPWTRHAIDPVCNGSAHDMLFADVDGDGERELVANAFHCPIPGLFIYKRGADLAKPWHKHTVGLRVDSEGLAAGDLNGDGRVEIVHGPDWYISPPAGPLSGPWERRTYAPSFREMCRVALVDITANGQLDIVLVESEYVDGKLSWFENRFAEDPEHPWVEHELNLGWVFAHSLDVRGEAGQVHVFVAEMAAGGWEQPYNWDARLIEYTTPDRGKTWQR